MQGMARSRTSLTTSLSAAPGKARATATFDVVLHKAADSFHDGPAEGFGRDGRPGCTWTHEQGSQMMLDYLIDENHIDIDQHGRNFVKSLIDGVPLSSSVREERGFLFEIVANKRNSVDVDKFDYISRDCYNVGLKTSYDFERCGARCGL